MVGNGQHLHKSIYFAVNEVKVKDIEHDMSNVRGKNNA